MAPHPYVSLNIFMALDAMGCGGHCPNPTGENHVPQTADHASALIVLILPYERRTKISHYEPLLRNADIWGHCSFYTTLPAHAILTVPHRQHAMALTS